MFSTFRDLFSLQSSGRFATYGKKIASQTKTHFAQKSLISSANLHESPGE